jgi:holo-[acyl-carrier protein] synthase
VIFGIGTDLVQVERIETTYQRFGQHFVDRLLMPEERALFDPGRRPVRFLAMRFAAKEAISKALGTGFRHGVWIRDLGFRPNAWGKPEVIFSPRGRAVADRLGAGEGHVSLTDEAGLVVAFAVLMRKGA